MPLYKTEAINLRTIKFSESDKLVCLFTKERGKLSAIAKSALKPTSKYCGRLEVFGYNNYLLASGKNIDIISQVETIDSFYSIRASEKSLFAGLYIVKVVYYFLEEKNPDVLLFDLVLDSLKLLKKNIEPSSVVRFFDVNFAKIEGFLPLEKFTKDLRNRLLKFKDFEKNFIFSENELEFIDYVLHPKISEHVGRDVSLWKNILLH